MAAVRIQHRSEHNVVFALHTLQPLAGPQEPCPVCGRAHVFKTYHMALDDTGSAIVSDSVWEQIKRLGPVTGFELTNGVAKPPPQSIGIGTPVFLGQPVITLDQ